MNALIIALLLLGLCLALIMGLMNALQRLKPDPLQTNFDQRARGPQFHDHSAGEHSADPQSPRSQFAWQSRSHSQPPD
jgi:hypothetical protein